MWGAVFITNSYILDAFHTVSLFHFHSPNIYQLALSDYYALLLVLYRSVILSFFLVTVHPLSFHSLSSLILACHHQHTLHLHQSPCTNNGWVVTIGPKLMLAGLGGSLPGYLMESSIGKVRKWSVVDGDHGVVCCSQCWNEQSVLDST